MKIDAPPPATTFGVPITTFSLFSTSLPIRSTMTGSQGRPALQSARHRLLVLIWCSACSCFGFGWTFLPRFGRHTLSTNLSRGNGGRRQFLPASQVEEEEKTHGSIVDPLQAGEEAVLHEPLTGLPVGIPVDPLQAGEEAVLHEPLADLPVGIPDSFRVVRQYHTAVQEPFQWDSIGLETSDVDRLELSSGNISLPVALMLFDSDEYPSFSRARKACRKGNILIHRGPLQMPEDETTEAANVFDAERCKKGRVGDRIFPGDVIGKQVRMGSGYFPVLGYKKPFDLPVVYEDDHCALVNKPSGVVVYSQKNGGHGSRTVRAALPFVLEPPVLGTYAVMRRPASVHRLDKPTSGVLCIAKTKPAMIHLSRQFHDRIIKKTYFAIVNGIPPETPVTAITPRAAFELGVDVDPDDAKGGWHLIDAALDGKHAVTVWRAVRYAKSLRAHDGYLTLVELKPKTGRYHQLRRHMAWECQCPLVGDGEYDEGTASAMSFRERGLFLCSTRVVLEHPYYNTDETRAQWRPDITSKFEECSTWLSKADRVMLTAQIALPSKFESLLNHEEQRYHKLEQ